VQRNERSDLHEIPAMVIFETYVGLETVSRHILVSSYSQLPSQPWSHLVHVVLVSWNQLQKIDTNVLC